jgi:hypothetical protein
MDQFGRDVRFVPKAEISLNSTGASADAPAELSCHSSEHGKGSHCFVG